MQCPELHLVSCSGARTYEQEEPTLTALTCVEVYLQAVGDPRGVIHLPVSPLTCKHCQGHIPADCLAANRDSTVVLSCISWPHCRDMKQEGSAARILGDAPVLQVSSCKAAPVGCHHVDPKGTGKVAQGTWEISCRASCSIDHRVGWAIKT